MLREVGVLEMSAIKRKIDTFPDSITLYKAEHDVFLNDEFDYDIDGWTVTDGEWHHVTIDTNDDNSLGLEGDVLVGAMGSYYGGSVVRTIELPFWGEFAFDFLLQNNLGIKNRLRLQLNGITILDLSRPTTFQRSRIYGLPAGKHEFKFIYDVEDDVLGHKAVIDNFLVTTAKRIPCFVQNYVPPSPMLDLGMTKILRGHTRTQEMKRRDTTISFSAQMIPIHYVYLQQCYHGVFYIVDEFTNIYRGIITKYAPKGQVVGRLYLVDLTFMCDSDIGVGFANYNNVNL
jgi:hypothetical protein